MGEYLEIAAKLKPFLTEQEGFISAERFKSLTEEGKLLSLSFWENEDAIGKWRNKVEHKFGQDTGRKKLFHSYRIRVAEIVRDYTHKDRKEAPINIHASHRDE